MWDPSDKTPIRLTQEQAEIIANLEPVSFEGIESKLLTKDDPLFERLIKALNKERD